MRQLLFRVLKQSKVLRVDSEIRVPAVTLVNPILVPFFVCSRLDEELHLHLFKLAGSENEVSWCDFVAERLANLANSERRLLAGGSRHVSEVDEDSLSGFRTQIVHALVVSDRAEVSLEESRKLFGFSPLPAIATETTGNLVKSAFRCAALLLGKLFFEVVCAEALVAREAFNKRVAEHVDVARRFPHLAGKNHR